MQCIPALFTLYKLAYKALTCCRKTSPIVNVVMGFGLLQTYKWWAKKTVGVTFKKVHGVRHFKIKHDTDLNPFLEAAGISGG